jgi:hypothetical protein
VKKNKCSQACQEDPKKLANSQRDPDAADASANASSDIRQRQKQKDEKEAKQEDWQEQKERRRLKLLRYELYARYGVHADPGKSVNHNIALALHAMQKWHYFSCPCNMACHDLTTNHSPLPTF